MPAKRKAANSGSPSTATIGFEAKLWLTVGMSNAEVQLTNRSRFTSTFEIQQSKFA